MGGATVAMATVPVVQGGRATRGKNITKQAKSYEHAE